MWSIKLRFVSPAIYIAILEFFILLMKSSRFVLFCLKSPAGYLYCVLITELLLFVLIVSVASDKMPLLFVTKSDFSLNIKEL